MRLGQDDTKTFGTLLRGVLPLQINWKAEIEENRDHLTLEEAEAEFRRRGLPVPFWLAAGYNGEIEALGGVPTNVGVLGTTWQSYRILSGTGPTPTASTVLSSPVVVSPPASPMPR
jgi:hypothetical protein